MKRAVSFRRALIILAIVEAAGLTGFVIAVLLRK